jgi:serine kinase of HPr protein (carbohydrate metabolism regulator)
MTVREAIQKLELDVLAGGAAADREISGGYASDMLSDVIGHAGAGNVWVTMQTHANVVAVAVLKELSAVIFVNGRKPDEETVAKAKSENVVLLATPLSAFEAAGRLYALGIRGERR